MMSDNGKKTNRMATRLSRLAFASPSDMVGRLLAGARERLEMDVAFVTEFGDGRLVFRALEGDAKSFNIVKDDDVPLSESYCQRVVEGRLPNVIPDASKNDETRDLEFTRDADVGSYVGIPLRLSSGEVYGTMCCLSHAPDPLLRQRDLDYMRALASLMTEHFEREDLDSDNRKLRTKATGLGALLAALETRDGYKVRHSEEVVRLSATVARFLQLSEAEIEKVEQAAFLHDIGKVGVPDSVLNKPGPLQEDEWRVVRRHPIVGEQLVLSVEGIEHLAPIIRAGHEHWGGTGYPDGIAGEEIPIESRIIFACDAFCAMVSERPARGRLGFPEALEEVRSNAGTVFCPTTVQAFESLYPILFEN